ncbi:hypothetical protein ACFPK9_14455 [Rubritalea spongiae]|uniref:Type II secretion system protein GspG C-terminal domain-containing protein n=1 Tax=Rubritalea spongiae TaxID=430797 RepID=A0ABW5E4L5_9BACT
MKKSRILILASFFAISLWTVWLLRTDPSSTHFRPELLSPAGGPTNENRSQTGGKTTNGARFPTHYDEAQTSKTTFDDKLSLPPYRIRRFDQSKQELRNDPSKWFEEAELLANSAYPEDVHIEQLHSLLEQYKDIVKGGSYPTGLNIEITNALLGKNPKKIALISQNHPRINASGELIDSWGTPYQFHNDSLTKISIRSAGPDQELYTEDDLY